MSCDFGSVESTVEVTLASLLKENYIIKIGAGKNTAYIRNTNYETVEK